MADVPDINPMVFYGILGMAPKTAEPESSRLMSKLLTNQVFAIDM
jgi:hypothetical protein